ncbi:hypothetical protein Dda_2812 [Drechslerella dactyloides]|uniref:CTLH domain-containing protein n=1 Tax=Drechslerella dactyloides TaxID=74499 RepID=A0AAD6J0A3_DREDA|nr:hypothetical protein Dda_2812 [Drechslerella dactyloides]
METPKISFATFGMVILDDIYFNDCEEPIQDAVGGSGTYSTIGARLFCSGPGPQPTAVGWVMRIGVGFPAETLDKLKSWGTTMHLIHEAASGPSRGHLHYEDTTLGPKTFRYISPPLWSLPEHFANTPCLSSAAFHFLAPPAHVFRDVPKLLALRREAGIAERPLVIWEPHPPSCTPRFFHAYRKAVASLVDVFSPNHMELAALLGVEVPSPDGVFDKETYENMAKRFIEKGIGEGGSGWLVLRAGEHGYMVYGRKMDSPTWLPPYHEKGSTRVVDATGAGNAYLGGFTLGLVETGDVIEAAAYGAVAASFVIEQMGVPELTVEGDGERWNGDDTSIAATQPSLPSPTEWEKKIDDIRPSKSDMNTLVMNYLIIGGYPSAAAKFAQEANIHPQVNLDAIHQRNRICTYIHEGNIKSAIEMINDFQPELLQTHRRLHFALLRLQLIELIRASMATNGDIQPALNFAETQLAPRAPEYPEFLKDLEHTMALLCFPPDQLSPPLAKLMDPDMRKHVAAMVNEAILSHQDVLPEAKLRSLVRLRAWVEAKAAKSESERLRSIPHLDLGLVPAKSENGSSAI